MADASLSTYPTSVDTFNRISDLDENTLKKSNQYKKLVNAGNYAGAKAYLNDEGNSDLKQCAINAEIVNKHSDAIVAIENDINDNVKSNINDINQSVNDIENKLGYKIDNVADGVSLTINNKTPILIKGSGKTTVYDYNNSGNSIIINTSKFICPNIKRTDDTHVSDKIVYLSDEAYSLFESSFYGQGFSTYGDSLYYYIVPNTKWFNTDGQSITKKNLLPYSIEGGIMTSGSGAKWFPFGYNDGSKSVNASFKQHISDITCMQLVVECTGFSSTNISTYGIIKYVII